MKSLGIIGGIGPASSAELYLKITENVHKRGLSSRPNIVLNSIPLPIVVEEDLILRGKTDAYIPFLQDSTRFLESAGVDIVIMACNTLHKHEDVVINTLKSAEFLSLKTAVPLFLKEKGIKKIGILGTSITACELYNDPLQVIGIEALSPSRVLQESLDTAIQHIVTDQWNENDRENVQAAMHQLETLGADAMLLACTDLWLLNCTCDLETFDTVDLLAELAVNSLL